MFRYVRLWLAFLKASWMADIEYRMNITVRIFGEVAWYLTQLSVFEVLYLHTPSISGWDVNAMRVFMGTLFIVDNVYMMIFHENLETFNSLVRKGDLDLYLVKPINAQFMVSCRKVSLPYLGNFLIVLVYLFWAVPRLSAPVGALELLGFVFLLLCGLITYYSLRFMFSTLAILVQDAASVQFVWHQLFRLATRPDPIYPQALRLLVLLFFPVAFMASVPARILVEGVHLEYLLASPVVAGVLLFCSHLFWERSLKFYSSASS